MSDLYDRFYAICEQKGTKPSIVCRQAGVATSLPTELKMGRKQSISLRTASKICDVLGCTVHDLMGIPSVDAPGVDGYDKLDELDKAKVEAYVAGLLAQDKYHTGGGDV